MIYLNNAGLGQPAAATRARIAAHAVLEDRLGPVAAKAQVDTELASVTAHAARVLGTPSTADRIGIEATTTAAWTAILLTRDLRGRTVLVAPDEWGANLRLLQRLVPMAGGQIVRLPPLDQGLDAWAAAITDKVAAIVLPHVSSVQGRLYPLARIGALPRPEDCIVLVDIAQSIGQVPLALDGLGIDAVAGTCRKWLRGPRGTALYWTAPRMGDLCQPAILAPSEVNIGLRLGLGVALDAAARTGIDAVAHAIAAKSQALYHAAQQIGLNTVAGHAPETGSVCLAIPHGAQARVAQALSAAGVHTKFPNPAQDEPFATPAPQGFVPLRLAPHVDTVKAAIDTTIAALKSAL